MKNLRLAVFDCDGTLVDSQHSIIATMTATFERYNHTPPNASSIRRVIGLPLIQCISILLSGSDQVEYDKMAETYKKLFHEERIAGNMNEPLFPGTIETIENLADAGWLLGVATGKAMRGLKATLEPYDLLKHFITMQTADIAQGKPNPDMLYRAISETGVMASDTVMIGDTTFDIEMACNAGIKSIGVSWGYHPTEELLEAGADRIIGDFHELPLALETIIQDKTEEQSENVG